MHRSAATAVQQNKLVSKMSQQRLTLRTRSSIPSRDTLVDRLEEGWSISIATASLLQASSAIACSDCDSLLGTDIGQTFFAFCNSKSDVCIVLVVLYIIPKN